MTSTKFGSASADEREWLARGFPELFNALANLGRLYLSISMQVRRKPLIGGPFGTGRYSLCSHNEIGSGLDRVNYLVIEDQTWLVIGIGESIGVALGKARSFLASLDPSVYSRFIAQLVVQREQERLADDKARLLRQEQRIAEHKQNVTPIAKNIPKRRREIFDASEGKCHYCSTPLTLDGRWHIEHKMPKALMGGNEPSNLVAACAPCNHKKRDRTDQEFIASRSAA